MTDTVTPDPCPIHTLDEAVIWLSENDIQVVFKGRRIVMLYRYPEGQGVFNPETVSTWRDVGNGGFDARGTLMMATRDLWAKVNKAVKA